MALKYGKYTTEAAVADKEHADKDDGDELKIPEGQTVLRILPPISDGSPFREIWQHFIDVQGKVRVVVCPKKMHGGRCLVCERIDELRVSGIPEEREMADSMYHRRTNLCNVINRGNQSAGPKVWRFGKTIADLLRGYRLDARGGGDFSDPEVGFDLIVDRIGTTKENTRYQVRPDRRSTPLSDNEEEAQAWIDGQHNLDRYSVPTPEDELYELLGGGNASRRLARAPGAVTRAYAQAPEMQSAPALPSGPTRGFDPRAWKVPAQTQTAESQMGTGAVTWRPSNKT